MLCYLSITADSPADCHPAAAPSGAAAASPQPAETRPAVCPSHQPNYNPRYECVLTALLFKDFYHSAKILLDTVVYGHFDYLQF